MTDRPATNNTTEQQPAPANNAPANNSPSTDDLDSMVGFLLTLMELHVDACGDLSEAEDEVTRAHQAAMVYSGNAAIDVGKLSRAHLPAKNQSIALIESELLSIIFNQHDKHWENFELCRDGNPPALPADLEVRRGNLPGKFQSVESRLAAVTTRVAELPVDGDGRKSGCESVLETAKAIVEGAGSSTAIACGTFKLPEVTDEGVAAIVEQGKTAYMEAGKSESEALAAVDAKLGKTLEEKKAAITKKTAAKFGIDSEGGKNGAVLSAEQEIALAETAIDKLDNLVALAKAAK